MSRRKPRPGNVPLTGPQATDLIIDAGLLTRGRIEKVSSGPGYDAVLPAEDLGKLAVAAKHYADENAILREVNAALRRQRDDARSLATVFKGALESLGYQVIHP